MREAVITAPRDVAALRAEIMAMREKVRAAHPVKAGRFDVKHSPGGMMDAEFAVQFLVLAQAASHPELIHNVGNIALLQRAEAARPAAAGRRRKPPPTPTASCAACSTGPAWTSSRPRCRPSALAAERQAVLALWQSVFS